MSQSTADIVANAGDSIVFTFTPQTGGLAGLVGSSLVGVSTASYSPLTVTGNATTIPKVPNGDSIVQLVLLLGPNTETCGLSYSVNKGASAAYFLNRPVFNPIVEVDLFGK